MTIIAQNWNLKCLSQNNQNVTVHTKMITVINQTRRNALPVEKRTLFSNFDQFLGLRPIKTR